MVTHKVAQSLNLQQQLLRPNYRYVNDTALNESYVINTLLWDRWERQGWQVCYMSCASFAQDCEREDIKVPLVTSLLKEAVDGRGPVNQSPSCTHLRPA